ncbi:MAG: glycosyltransferase family 4 protein [Myxococcota bacterium]
MRALLVSQVFAPEPGAVGEHLFQATAELAKRGATVRVVTSRHGYDDPTLTFPAHEMMGGVEVLRVPWSSFGKSSVGHRIAGSAGFVLQSTLRSLRGFKPDIVIVGTSPPLSSLVGKALARIHRVPLLYWVMDVNPDQIVALGRLSERHPAVIALRAWNNRIARTADHLVVLDDDMAVRMRAKGALADRMTVLPPWPLDDYIEPVEHAQNPFRAEHDLVGKRVVMFSGNLSTASPVTTFIEAARRVTHLQGLRIYVVGGGEGKKRLDAELARDPIANVVSLPYEPLERLRFSLSAADVHLVSLGDAMRGIVHPSKLYGALAAGRPIIYLGPAASHIDRVVQDHGIGWRVAHGDVDAAERLLERVTVMPQHELDALGKKARQLAEHRFSKQRLCGGFCDVVERVANAQ